MVIETTVNGVVTERFDDDTRTHSRLDPSGTVIEQRPFSTEENAEADVRIAHATREHTATGLRGKAEEGIATLLASIDTLQSITALPNNQITPSHTKDVARETRRVARTLVAVTRLVAEALDSDDIGD